MLNTKKLLTKILGKCVRYTDDSVTTGNTTYDGYYYADKAIVLPTGAQIISITPWTATSNRSAIAQRMWQVDNTVTIRVWTKQASTEVGLRVSYIFGGVIHKLHYVISNLFREGVTVC